MSVRAIDPSRFEVRTGEWYAFEFEGRKFFAVADLLSESGWCRLTEIPDPYICKHCGLPYQKGRHFPPDEDHEYAMRGAAI